MASDQSIREQVSRMTFSLNQDTYMDRNPWEALIDGNQHMLTGGFSRYHIYREGRYSLPNDEIEQQREEIMHILVMDILDQQLYLAPLAEPPRKILDVATGIGLWAIEMGDRYPDATVLGLDLSSIQPTSYVYAIIPQGDWIIWTNDQKRAPPNVNFQVDDVEDTWVHGHDYDFIHIREACAYMRSTPIVIENAIEHLKPGGWFEVQEFHWIAENEDGTIDDDVPVNQFMKLMSAAARTEGRNIPIVPDIGVIMEKAGFVDITKTTFRVPYGTWPADPVERNRGAVFALNAELILPTSDRLLSYVGVTPNQAEILYTNCIDMFNDSSIRSYATYYVWYGRKPLVTNDTDSGERIS
ncbi:S-adenosyl-L-methionine-dependent methyltransferase [Xylaria nigripes]|nr:S-adenosyl-L-methionine-dependent methyltransferase [Xylaria nigripes]